MSFTTFVPAEFMHRYQDSWLTYWQQYTILAALVADSWEKNGQIASQALKTYLRKLSARLNEEEDKAWEETAWEQIWSYISERKNVLETVGKLNKMLHDNPYVQTIVNHHRHKEDVLKLLLLPENKTLKSFSPDFLENETQQSGVYTNKGDKLTAIGDLHGDFAATIRVLQNMNIIQVDAEKHTNNVKLTEDNHVHQLQKLTFPHHSKTILYMPLDYSAYTWIYANNMLVQTGDLFDRGFNSREIIELFMHLDRTSGDGQVVNMAGNHEFMQYQYGMSEMDSVYKMYQIPKDSMSFGESQNWDSNRKGNLAPGSKYFEWIARLPIIVYETKSKTVFSHGCVVEKWTNVHAINKSVGQIWDNVRSAWNLDYRRAWDRVRRIRSVFENIGEDSPLNCVINGRQPKALSEVDGPVWNRYYNNAVTQNDKLQDQLKRTVESFATNHMQVDRLICAHTITNMKHIQEELTSGNDCKFKPEQHPVGQTPSVWFIDIGMTEGYGEGKRWGGVELTTSAWGVTQIEAKHPHC